jgi:GNAT superfamily N-acetyltransferase
MTSVRRATPGDARAIAEVQVETWRTAYQGVVPQEVLDGLDVGEREQMWERASGNDRVAVFVAERDGQIAGFVSVGPCRDLDGTGELYAIYVRPGAWSTGTGLALMEAAVPWLAERWPEAVLWVAKENPRARRFYELYGWKADRERIEEVVPGARIDEVLYRLDLLDRS